MAYRIRHPRQCKGSRAVFDITTVTGLHISLPTVLLSHLKWPNAVGRKRNTNFLPISVGSNSGPLREDQAFTVVKSTTGTKLHKP